MKNKIMIELEIPNIEKKYDLFIPINKTVGTIKKLIETSLIELTGNSYVPKESTNFYNKDTGLIYDINQVVRETDMKNGTRIILL